MNIDPRTCHPCLLLPVFAAIGCTHPSLLGVGADVDQEQANTIQLTSVPGARPSQPRPTTVISGRADEFAWMRRPSLGDVDGDGRDDFLVDATRLDEMYPYENRGFLFYGRADFPAQLSTADADAVLVTGELSSNGLGDLNGDGLADFALGDYTGCEILFGSSTRFTGQQKWQTRGLAWNPPTPGESMLYLRPLGDVDGDGMAELRVTVISQVPENEVGTREGPEIITDYLVAGRRGGWPTGNWDPTWAVAMLGDEPPALEANGASPIVRRLSISGTGDLDGDGYTDLLALGRWQAWVFYGSDRGLRGTLTPAQADATLTWPHDPNAPRVQFGSTIPFILGDVDGDGTADIGVPDEGELGIVYGTKRRWSGRVELVPELTIVRRSTAPAEESSWMPLAVDSSYSESLTAAERWELPPTPSASIRVSVADLDGDAHRELVLHENRLPAVRSYQDPTTTVMYALNGPGRHATGRYLLSDADIYRADGVGGADAALTSGIPLDPGGDFDGDGSTDLIFGVIENPATAESKSSLHLVPGAPRVPD